MKYNTAENILYVYKGVAKHKPYLIILLILALFCNAASRFIWLFLGKYIVEFIGAGIAAEKLMSMVVFLTLANIICLIGQNTVNFWKDPAAFYVRPMFMLERNKKVISLFYERLEEREVLDAIEKSKASTRNVDVGIEGIIRFTLDLCTHLFTCILAAVILAFLSIPLAVAVLLFGILSYLSVEKASKKEKQLTNDDVLKEKRELEYFKKISSDFSYGKDIRLFQLREKLNATQKELNGVLHEKTRLARKSWLISGMFTNSMDMLREGLLYAALIYLILKGDLGIGDFILYAGCVRQMADALMNLMKISAHLRKCSAETNDYRALNEYCDEQKDEGSKPEEASGYEIRFENVSFKYPGSESYALKDVNLTLNPSEKLAVVGINGAGKTTFIKLLLKLYKPSEGRILLNGRDIESISTREYYRLFAPVFQDMECYGFTLAENVSMKAGEETDAKRVIACLEQAGLKEKLNSLPKGIDSPMLRVHHNDGILLSGGEKQKMALARALYKDAPVVILDEPTAALDAHAESELYKRFDSFVKGKLAVYVSHRLASTGFCDHIALFEDGRISEYGSHEELMRKKGRYAGLFEMQAQYYREEEKDEEAAC